MTYPILALSGESTSEAVAKLHFALATERAKGEEFLRVDFLSADHMSRLRGAVLHVLKERKRLRKILFFLLAEDFSSEKKRGGAACQQISGACRGARASRGRKFLYLGSLLIVY